MTALDIHEYQKRYDSAIRRIKASDIPEANRSDVIPIYSGTAVLHFWPST